MIPQLINFICTLFILFLSVLNSHAQSNNMFASSDRILIQKTQSSFIFIFESGEIRSKEVPGLANGMAKKFNGEIGHIYQHSIKGFSANMSDASAAKLAQESKSIKYYERDGIIWMVDSLKSNSIQGSKKNTLSLSNKKIKDIPQEIPAGIFRVGGPVTVDVESPEAWVLDSGVDDTHPDLNVGLSVNFSHTGKNTGSDVHGHGTHIAGTIGAIDNEIDVVGVAAGAVINSVRILGPSGKGRVSDAIKGIDYISKFAQPGDCVNMSFGILGHWQSLHDSILNLANLGIRIAIAAGNEAEDANNYEPAHINHPNIYTVSAIDSNDEFASFSNFGSSVDFAAPGVQILSTKKGGGVTVLSGTSMATPHVCGILLLNEFPNSNGTALRDPDGNPDPIISK